MASAYYEAKCTYMKIFFFTFFLLGQAQAFRRYCSSEDYYIRRRRNLRWFGYRDLHSKNVLSSQHREILRRLEKRRWIIRMEPFPWFAGTHLTNSDRHGALWWWSREWSVSG
jgi:hypothetical protein